MKWRDKYLKKVTCPRCGLKSLEGVDCCPDCGLVFSRLALATNKDAKNKIKRRDRDFIIKTSKLPSDVSFLKLLLLCIFLGPAGAHCYYVGRYWRGGLLSLTFACIVMFVVFNAPLVQINNGVLLGALSTICGIIELLWIWDLITIIFKKFKVPVAIDIDKGVSKGEKDSKRKEFFKDTVLENVQDDVAKNSRTKKQTKEGQDK